MSPSKSNPVTQLENLKKKALEPPCTACPLYKERTFQPTFGYGKTEFPDLFFVGQNAGAKEDECSIPFSGPAGQLLERLITYLGYTWEDVYKDNIAKCKSKDNRPPRKEEAETCSSLFLKKQIDIVKPRVIVAVGKPAANYLLGNNLPMYKLLGQWYKYKKYPVRVIYHPAAALHNGEHTSEGVRIKKSMQEELEIVLKYLQEF